MIPASYEPLVKPDAVIPEDVRALDEQILALLSLRDLLSAEVRAHRRSGLPYGVLSAELQMVKLAISVRLDELDRHVLETAHRLCDEALAEHPNKLPIISAVDILHSMYGLSVYRNKLTFKFRSYFTTGGSRRNHTMRVYSLLRRNGFVRTSGASVRSPTYSREADLDAYRD